MPIDIIPVAFDGPKEAVSESFWSILGANKLMAVASVDASALSHINTAFFCATEDGRLIFVSDPQSVHCQNIKKRPHVAVAIYSSEQQWDDLKRGVQAFGECQRVEASQVDATRQLYSERFPAFREYYDGLSIERREEVDRSFFRIEIRHIKLFDEPCFGEETLVLARLETKER